MPTKCGEPDGRAKEMIFRQSSTLIVHIVEAEYIVEVGWAMHLI